MYIWTFEFMYIWIYVYMYIRTYANICIYEYMYIWTYVYMNVYYIYNLFVFFVFLLNSKTLWQKGGVGVCSLELFSFNLCHILARGGDLTQPSFPQATRDSPVKNEERFQVSPVQWPWVPSQKKKNMSNCVGGNRAGASTCKYIDYVCIYCCCNRYYYLYVCILWCAGVIRYGILYPVWISL